MCASVHRLHNARIYTMATRRVFRSAFAFAGRRERPNTWTSNVAQRQVATGLARAHATWLRRASTATLPRMQQEAATVDSSAAAGNAAQAGARAKLNALRERKAAIQLVRCAARCVCGGHGQFTLGAWCVARVRADRQSCGAHPPVASSSK